MASSWVQECSDFSRVRWTRISIFVLVHCNNRHVASSVIFDAILKLTSAQIICIRVVCKT